MENIQNSLAYLKGLIDGLDFGENNASAKVFKAMTNILEEMTDEIDVLNGQVDYNTDMIEDILDEEFDLDEEDLDADEIIDVECPHCGEIIYFDQFTFQNEEDLICPVCNENIDDDDVFDEDDNIQE